MAISEQDWKEEQARVTEVTTKIGNKISQLEASVGDIREVVIDMRKDFWDEVTVNFSNPDDLGETSTNLRQQSQVLAEREHAHLQSSKLLKSIENLWNPLTLDALIFKRMEPRRRKPFIWGQDLFG